MVLQLLPSALITDGRSTKPPMVQYILACHCCPPSRLLPVSAILAATRPAFCRCLQCSFPSMSVTERTLLNFNYMAWPSSIRSSKCCFTDLEAHLTFLRAAAPTRPFCLPLLLSHRMLLGWRLYSYHFTWLAHKSNIAQPSAPPGKLASLPLSSLQAPNDYFILCSAGQS